MDIEQNLQRCSASRLRRLAMVIDTKLGLQKECGKDGSGRGKCVECGMLCSEFFAKGLGVRGRLWLAHEERQEIRRSERRMNRLESGSQRLEGTEMKKEALGLKKRANLTAFLKQTTAHFSGLVDMPPKNADTNKGAKCQPC